jgi:hypothetical protein
MTAKDMEAWIKELDSQPEQYQVNRRCVHCELNPNCRTFQDYLTSAIKVCVLASGQGPKLGKIKGSAIRDLPAGAKSSLAVGIKMCDIAVKRVREQIKDEALKSGDMDMGNGMIYSIKLRGDRLLLTSKALPILAKYVSAKDITNATRLSLPSLTAAAARRVKGPMRKIIVNELNDRLQQAGAIVVSERPYMETITCPKKSPLAKAKPPSSSPSRGRTQSR